MMKLIGSTTSPYVRKIRLILNDFKYEYEFETLQALSPDGAIKLKSYGPIIRVPILVSEGKTIFDSSIIAEYLFEKKGLILSIDEKLKLKLIDELCDSGITLFQQKLWKIDDNWSDERSKKVLNRYHFILDELEETLDQLNNLQKDWLYCVLDWLVFRSVLKWDEKYKKLKAFFVKNQSIEKFVNTNPRL